MCYLSSDSIINLEKLLPLCSASFFRASISSGDPEIEAVLKMVFRPSSVPLFGLPFGRPPPSLYPPLGISYPFIKRVIKSRILTIRIAKRMMFSLLVSELSFLFSSSFMLTPLIVWFSMSVNKGATPPRSYFLRSSTSHFMNSKISAAIAIFSVFVSGFFFLRFRIT